MIKYEVVWPTEAFVEAGDSILPTCQSLVNRNFFNVFMSQGLVTIILWVHIFLRTNFRNFEANHVTLNPQN